MDEKQAEAFVKSIVVEALKGQGWDSSFAKTLKLRHTRYLPIGAESGNPEICRVFTGEDVSMMVHTRQNDDGSETMLWAEIEGPPLAQAESPSHDNDGNESFWL